jgi:hypothetical protein
MNKIHIPLHSFVDLITNSSSEVFVTPTKKTKEVIYDLIGYYLKANGINTKPENAVDVMFTCLVWDDNQDKEITVCEGHELFNNSGQVGVNIIVLPGYENIKGYTFALQSLVDSMDAVEKYN